MKSFHERFLELQTRLVVGKTKVNDFANFNYRTKPQILEEIKPLARELNIVVYTTSDLVAFGERIFVKSTAIAHDVENPELRKEATAFAELQAKSGTKMSEPQLTGSSDSYAGKYALGNLFNLDDNLDPDDAKMAEITGVRPETIKALEKTTVDTKKATTIDLRSKIIGIQLTDLNAKLANELAREIASAEVVDELANKMLSTKATAAKLKYNTTTKLWEE